MTLYVFCGIPASGKTTTATQFAQVDNTKLYSYDTVKHELKLKHFDDICVEIYANINDDLLNGFNVVYDAPNHRLQYRKEILNILSDINCKKICVVLSTPFEECLKRNGDRKTKLPEFVLYEIYNKFEYPTLDEGWDEIIVINNDEDIENLKKEIKNLNLL